MKQLVLDIAQPEPPSLANYVAGPNAELVARLEEIAAGASGETSLYVFGAPGSGRSHLLLALVAAARRPAGYARAGRLPASAVGRLIAVDDVEQLSGDEQVQLFRLIEEARDSHGAVVVAGSLPPAELPLRDDLKSRLAWGLVYQARPLDEAERVALLAAEATRRGLELPPEVLEWLVRRAPRDLGSLMAALERLDRASLERQRPVTLALARATLGLE